MKLNLVWTMLNIIYKIVKHNTQGKNVIARKDVKNATLVYFVLSIIQNISFGVLIQSKSGVLPMT